MCKNLDNHTINGEVDTNAVMTAGGIVVVGGLTYAAAKYGTKKIPFLVDNPLISAALKAGLGVGSALLIPEMLTNPYGIAALSGLGASTVEDLNEKYDFVKGLYDGWETFDLNGNNGGNSMDIPHKEVTVHA